MAKKSMIAREAEASQTGCSRQAEKRKALKAIVRNVNSSGRRARRSTGKAEQACRVMAARRVSATVAR